MYFFCTKRQGFTNGSKDRTRGKASYFTPRDKSFGEVVFSRSLAGSNNTLRMNAKVLTLIHQSKVVQTFKVQCNVYATMGKKMHLQKLKTIPNNQNFKDTQLHNPLYNHVLKQGSHYYIPKT